MNAEEVKKVFAAYTFYHKDLMEHLDRFLECRDIYDAEVKKTGKIPYGPITVNMKHWFELVYTSLKDEWVCDNITEQEFWYLVGICRDE